MPPLQPLDGKIELFALQYSVHDKIQYVTPNVGSGDLLCIINPEEVRVQNGLQDASDPGYHIHIALRKIPIEPVRYIQCPVDSQREKIVSRYCFGLACSL